MFPGAHDEIHYNEEGEVLGWSTRAIDVEYCELCGGAHSSWNCPNEVLDEEDGREEPEDYAE